MRRLFDRYFQLQISLSYYSTLSNGHVYRIIIILKLMIQLVYREYPENHLNYLEWVTLAGGRSERQFCCNTSRDGRPRTSYTDGVGIGSPNGSCFSLTKHMDNQIQTLARRLTYTVLHAHSHTYKQTQTHPLTCTRTRRHTSLLYNS